VNTDEITVILPVFGRPGLLGEAIESVLSQESTSWRLLIADDGSDATTRDFISKMLAERGDSRVKWIRRAKNLGLFDNLNKAIVEAETEWLLLLCSDDTLIPSALRRCGEMRELWPESRLFLSSFISVNSDGSERASDSASHHDRISKHSCQVVPEKMVPALLKLGAVNGNLTGMFFSRGLWAAAGEFRRDWRHAADWEWLVRAASLEAIVLNREPIARVRTHDDQLSNKNRKSGHETIEVAEVVKVLLAHPLLAKEKERSRWAAHIMQFQMWNLLKRLSETPLAQNIEALRAVHKSAGLRQTVRALVQWLPTRWRKLMLRREQ